jgi:hypothetical protein
MKTITAFLLMIFLLQSCSLTIFPYLKPAEKEHKQPTKKEREQLSENIGKLEPRKRLRIETTEFRTECLLHHFSEDSLVVFSQNDNGFKWIAFNQVERLDVRVPRSAGWGAVRGAAIGGAIGGTIGAIYAVATWDEVDVGDNELISNTTSTLRLFGAVGIFGLPSMLVGGVVGAMFPGEKWQQVHLPGRVSFHMNADRNLIVQYSLSF